MYVYYAHADLPEKYEGMPIGIQMVGRRFQEEKILSIAKTVEAIIATPTVCKDM